MPTASPLHTEHPHRLGIAAAFAAICLVWGSIYLAVRFALETLPPFLMVGTRLGFAGMILYLWARWRGAAPPTGRHWGAAAIVGTMVVAIGAGAVAWAQLRVPSGLTSLLLATEPFWLVLLDWWWHHGPRPNRGVVTGLALGFGGLALLIGPGNMAGGGPVDLMGAAVILTASVSWAAGSLYSRTAPQPGSLLLAAAMQMVAGGVLLLAAGTLTHEWARVDLAAVSLRSWIAYGYLLVFGSVITFPAYIWLLQQVSAARVAVYAYVNPVVAVFLGWAFAEEALTRRTLLAAAVIVAAVVLVITFGGKGKTVRPAPTPEEELEPSSSVS